MKTTLTRSIVAALASLALTCAASALNISPAQAVQSGNQTGQGDIDAAIAATIGGAVELYKQNVGGGESGALAGSYTTTFLNSPLDPKDATIVYNSGNIVGSPAWSLVKDGNQTPAWYLFDLTALGWNGTETLNYLDFWPNQGAISHISLYGTSKPRDFSVADGGSTLAFLGLGLALIAIVRRRMA
jgi:hypothetical protein